MKFEDRNKIVEDLSASIEWDKPSTSRTLKQIMAKRFSKVLGIDEQGAWEKVFDEDQQMPGRQSKYQYILDRTFKRPRDIIKFCNETLRSYKQDSSRAEMFRNAHVAAAREEYSKYVREELVDEMHQHFPDEHLAFDLLRLIGSMSFTLEKLEETHKEFSTRKQGLPAAATILRELYDFSVIAYLKVGGSGGGSEWVWRYEDTRAEYDERATVFRVHGALKEVLGLKQGRTQGKSEPVCSLETDVQSDSIPDDL